MKRLFALTMVFVFGLLTIACVKLDTIKSDFEEAGYAYSEDGSSWISGLLTTLKNEGLTVKVHVFTRGLNTAIVLEFEAEKELKQQLDENDTLKGLITDLDDADLVRGNFLLIPISLSSTSQQDMIDIFNGKYKEESSAKSE